MIDYSEAIEERLQHLAGLVSGWDSYGGLSISPRAIVTTRAIIREVMATGSNLPMPYIAPCGDGTLSVEWEMPDGNVLTIDVPLADGPVDILWVDADRVDAEELVCERWAVGKVIGGLLGREP